MSLVYVCRNITTVEGDDASSAPEIPFHEFPAGSRILNPPGEPAGWYVQQDA